MSLKVVEKLDRRPAYSKQPVHFKPHGFWYGVDGSWQEWCQSEMPHWVGSYRYQVDISKANVLILDNPRSIFKFHDEFATVRYPELRDLSMWIDWTRVAERWDGIEIAPYQWSLRMDMRVFWYYSWDAASGCVWNTDKITIRLADQTANPISG